MFKQFFSFGCLFLLGGAIYLASDRGSTASSGVKLGTNSSPSSAPSGVEPSRNTSSPTVLSQSGHQPVPEDFTWRVERVSDGDTIAVTNDTDKLKIRFACMDAPEKKQPLGMDSRSALQSLVDSGGGKVAVNIRDTDRYGRKVAEVWVQVNGQPVLVQEKMLAQGYAMVYHQYLSDCSSKDIALAAESQAKSQRLGVWGVPGFTPPWEYRKQQRG